MFKGWQALIGRFRPANLFIVASSAGGHTSGSTGVQACSVSGKTYTFVFIFVWMRGTLPRVRIDQLMDFAWKWMLPASLLNLFLTAAAIVVVKTVRP